MKNVVEFLKINSDNNPDRLFCCDDVYKYTYRESYRIVMSIASYFYSRGITNEPVLLKAERNCCSLLAILGIIMSNNYYVPINGDFSFEKEKSVIDSSNAKYEIVFNEKSNNDLEKFNYEEISGFQSGEDLYEVFSNSFNEENNIYTIYTSGSTGNPKGVLKTQKNMIAFVNNFIGTFNFENGLKIANQTPLFFDASMKDIYLAMATCSTIYFPDKSLFAMPVKLVEYLNENKIDYICWVPSALSIIVRLKTFNFIKPIYLKYVMFVGEVFMPKYLNMWIRELPNVTYANLYGSSEIAGVCLYKIIDNVLEEDKPIPLGKALLNNKVYLDDGEILIESDQIAKGYVNDEEKNKIVFSYKDGVKILRTGDYAFINEDSDIVFSSRKDYQIKHMGYRIELQEIDISINSLDYIDTCAVLFDSKSDKIHAFVSTNRFLESPVKMIIEDLKAKVPNYMVPNKITILEKMPFNANGKIDRVKLKEMMGV